MCGGGVFVRPIDPPFPFPQTTLLDVLAFRKTQGDIGGSVRINGAAVQPRAFAHIAGFAEQEDVHADYSTVREALEFSARLRLPATVSASQRAAFVDEVLTLLEMAPLSARRTGSLAQGELKRLTIAIELAANPAVLFLGEGPWWLGLGVACLLRFHLPSPPFPSLFTPPPPTDEPTTGLDSRAASVVMRVIRNVAATGRTVICTIHQPSAEVFFGFDALVCLIPGGTEAYVGPLGKASADLVAYLETQPGTERLQSGTNPASWMLEQLDGAKGQAVAAEFAKSPLAASGAAQRSAIEQAPAASASDLLTREAASPRPGFAVALATLLVRQLRYMWRATSWNGLRLFIFVFLALLFGLLYLQIDTSTQAGAFGQIATALNGLLFISIITVRVCGGRGAGRQSVVRCTPLTPPSFQLQLNTSIPNFARLRPVFYREKAAQYYPAAAYPISLIIAELPWSAFFGLVFLSIYYFMVRSDGELLWL